MAARTGGRPPSRRWMVLTMAVAGALWCSTLLPPPWGRHERELLRTLRVPALILLVVLVASWTAWCALRARRTDLVLTAIDEEPLDVSPNLMSCHGGSPVVALAGLERGAGVTTLTFNLAVCLALNCKGPGAEPGRGARPICLLAEGPLTGALGLDARPLDDFIARRPYRVGPEVVNLAVRHASGCELLCLAPSGRGIENVRPLVSELIRHYDAVLLDAGCGGSSVVDICVDIAEALLLVALPTVGSVETAGRWIEWVFSHKLEGKTALLLNRVTVGRPAPLELTFAFLHHAQLPEEPGRAALDQRGLPWTADGRLHCARALSILTHQLFPIRMSEKDVDAA